MTYRVKYYKDFKYGIVFCIKLKDTRPHNLLVFRNRQLRRVGWHPLFENVRATTENHSHTDHKQLYVFPTYVYENCKYKVYFKKGVYIGFR